jgi:aminoglycoside phosphotransferase (APT) family kinase protein
VASGHQPRRCRARTAALEHWIHGIGAAYPDYLAGDDAVHCDFQPANILASDGRITGVIDWDGPARGDCRLDLVTLRFGVHAIRCDPEVVRTLDQLLGSFPAEILLPAWAHMSVRMVDWALRHFTATDVGHWLDLAEQRAF